MNTATAMTGDLSAIDADTLRPTVEQIRQFRSEGFLKIDFVGLIGQKAFSDLRAAVEEAEALAHTDGKALQNGNILPGSFLRMTYLRFSYPAIDAVVRSPIVAEWAATLAGVDAVRVWIDETFIKEPAGSGTLWHQDIPHFPMDRRGLVSFWVALDAVEADMGAVQYLPRSHKLGSLGRSVNYDSTRPPSSLTLPQGYAQYLREDDWLSIGEPVTPTLRAGEAIIHDGFLLHGTDSNRSSKSRRGWAVVYFPSDTQYTGMPRAESDGLGLIPFAPFDHPKFPIVYARVPQDQERGENT